MVMNDSERDELLIRLDERVKTIQDDVKELKKDDKEDTDKFGKLRGRVIRLEVLASLGIAAAGGIGAVFG